jgi:hypothetical protein
LFDASWYHKSNVKEGIAVPINIQRDLLIDYEVVRTPMAGRFPGDYMESASKMEIAA